MTARPLVVAHRGSSAAVPEHTAAAYALALAEGADAVECDVRLTRDRQLVCLHDRRVDRTSDGRGAVAALTLDELRRLDMGAGRTDPGAGPAGILTVTELLDLLAGADRPVGLLAETKHPVLTGGEVERTLIQLLRRHPATAGAGAPVAPTIMSFSRYAVRRVRVLAPELPTVLLRTRLGRSGGDGRLPYGVRIVGPSITALRRHPGFVARARAAGNQVYVWTVDRPADIDLVLDLGVDAVITNRPADVLARLDGVPDDAR